MTSFEETRWVEPDEPELFVDRAPTFLHNVLGHPLLWVLRRWPAAAVWVHNHTEPDRPLYSGRDRIDPTTT